MSCVDTRTAIDHCGGCDQPCDQACGGGECVNNCDNFQDQCGDSCTDRDIDPLNCGECGNACDGDETCLNGNCRRYTLAGCDQCPCDACGDAQCCESQFLNTAVCVQGGGGGAVEVVDLPPKYQIGAEAEIHEPADSHAPLAEDAEGAVPAAAGRNLHLPAGAVVLRLPFNCGIGVAVQTGLRLSELTGLRREDIRLETGAHVHVIGKGRKERCTPLARQTRDALATWMKRELGADVPVLFPSARGSRLSADAVQYLVAKHAAIAGKTCPSLTRKRVTPHVLRHTTAMELLQAGTDRSVIAMWLGHESLETTQIYLDADLTLKEQVLAKTMPHDGQAGRYRPDDPLMAFLSSL